MQIGSEEVDFGREFQDKSKPSPEFSRLVASRLDEPPGTTFLFLILLILSSDILSFVLRSTITFETVQFKSQFSLQYFKFVWVRDICSTNLPQKLDQTVTDGHILTS